MTNFIEKSKNVYPYRTIHVEGCSALSRTRFMPNVMTRERIGATEVFRLDFCARCLGSVNNRNEAYTEFMNVVREFKTNQARVWKRVHLARKWAALVLETEKVILEMDGDDPEQKALNEEYLRTGRDGDYRLPEITFGR